jgi:ketosteroid isomerase-like protein
MNDELDDFLGEYIRSTNSHQFDAVALLIDDEAVYWFSNGSYRGVSAIRAAFKKTWSIIQDEEYAIEDLEWVTIDEQTATCIYTYRWRGVIDGAVREGIGRGTNVLRNDGRQWRIVHEHLSPRPAQQD